MKIKTKVWAKLHLVAPIRSVFKASWLKFLIKLNISKVNNEQQHKIIECVTEEGDKRSHLKWKSLFVDSL